MRPSSTVPSGSPAPCALCSRGAPCGRHGSAVVVGLTPVGALARLAARLPSIRHHPAGSSLTDEVVGFADVIVPDCDFQSLGGQSGELHIVEELLGQGRSHLP